MSRTRRVTRGVHISVESIVTKCKRLLYGAGYFTIVYLKEAGFYLLYSKFCFSRHDVNSSCRYEHFVLIR